MSIAMKLAIARFVNTAILPCIANASNDRWFVDGGLVSDSFSIMISISFIDPTLMLIDPGYIVQLLKRWYEKRKGDKSMMTQAEANE
jgi:hypothetical protein